MSPETESLHVSKRERCDGASEEPPHMAGCSRAYPAHLLRFFAPRRCTRRGQRLRPHRRSLLAVLLCDGVGSGARYCVNRRSGIRARCSCVCSFALLVYLSFVCMGASRVVCG